MRENGGKNTISATPRQLESLIRLSEARARLRFSPFVEKEDIEEAVNLIKVATQQAATDPVTGVIDMDMLQTGITSSSRARLSQIIDIIKTILRDYQENARKGGVSFFQFIEEINDKLDDKETPEGLRRIFDLFSEGTDIIKKENVIEICGQIAKEYDDPELHEALDRCAKNATTLTFDEFESIMTRKAYP